MDAYLKSAMFGMPVMSGGKWIFTLGDFTLLIGLITLFIEILEVAHANSDAIVNHSISMLVLRSIRAPRAPESPCDL